MTMQEIRAAARQKLKSWCRVCPVCNGRACAGEMPGMGGAGTGEGFMENVRGLAAVKLHLRVLHDANAPDTGVELFGHKLALPIMGAPMAGGASNLGGALGEEELASALHQGCHAAGTICWSGDGALPEFYEVGLEAVRKQGGKGIPTIKPRHPDEIIKRIRLAENIGALAVAIDVDAAGFQVMAAKGQPVGPKNADAIRALCAATSLPVILKGIMTPDEAELAASCGVAGIVVSNHGGRVLDSLPATIDVLPGIAQAVRGRIAVLMDGGIRSGGDVLKALALGADAVLVGRPLIVAAAGGGADGVALAVNQLAAELRSAMLLTGVASASSVPSAIIAARRTA